MVLMKTLLTLSILFACICFQGCSSSPTAKDCQYDDYLLKGIVKQVGDHFVIVSLPEAPETGPLKMWVNSKDQYLVEATSVFRYKVGANVIVLTQLKTGGENCSPLRMHVKNR